jgi:GR25 family glycosyltransferase involved in LPS biosynthesis
MSDERILVVVIRTPYSDRYKPIEALLRDDYRFRIQYVEATMAYSYRDLLSKNISFSHEKFELYYGRKLSPAEIGCAESHNSAREVIQSSLSGGVILEDDARIKNVDQFYNSVSNFLAQKSNSYSILNLTGFRNLNLKSYKAKSYYRIFVNPDLAVGYALTTLAASALHNANLPISGVADWPRSHCKYYVPNFVCINHGDSNTSSLIDSNSSFIRVKAKFNFKLKQFIRILFFFKLKDRVTLSEYFSNVLSTRVLWHIEKIRLTLIGFRNSK